MLNIEEILKVLPQRMPFVMIDRVVEFDPGKKVVAIKNVTFNEYFFSGHFPGKPVMPGVLIIEAMAQSSIMLFYPHTNFTKDKLKNTEIGVGVYTPDPQVSKDKPAYYLTASKVRFFHPVVPGDQLKIIIDPIKLISSAGIVKASVFVGDKEVAGGELTFTKK